MYFCQDVAETATVVLASRASAGTTRTTPVFLQEASLCQPRLTVCRCVEEVVLLVHDIEKLAPEANTLGFRVSGVFGVTVRRNWKVCNDVLPGDVAP